jgi:hypothetical protein
VLELLLARMETMQVKADADREERKADRSDLKEMMMKMMGTSHMEMVAENKPERDTKTMTCRETREVHLEEKEPTSVETKPEVAQQQDVPLEDA